VDLFSLNSCKSAVVGLLSGCRSVQGYRAAAYPRKICRKIVNFSSHLRTLTLWLSFLSADCYWNVLWFLWLVLLLLMQCCYYCYVLPH